MAQPGKGRSSRSVHLERGGRSFDIHSAVAGKAARMKGRDYFDYNLLATVILLSCFGLVMLYSTSAYKSAQGNDGSTFQYFGRQAWISGGALVLMLLESQIVDYHFLSKISSWVYAVSFALLCITPLVGRSVNGATRWIYLGPIGFQPAEIAKLAVIIMLPGVIIKIGRQIKKLQAVGLLLAIGGILSFLTFKLTENLSSAVIIAGITVGMICIAHPKGNLMMLWGTIAVVVVVLIILQYFKGISIDSDLARDNFRVRRVLAWLNPENSSESSAYQSMQALYAIGSGGFFGKGLGQSRQKLGAVPEAQNDMIFSIVCEELGVFGALIVILLFVFLLYRLYWIATNAPDLMGALMVSGIFIHIALQVVLNIGVVTNVLPTTGITLPFVSYGGTSVLFLMAEIGIALNVSKQIEFK